ncbi:MAG: DUF2807 domain-containing protein [Bacteroidetes bacterium]|nr:MAG: DUF2807 domain-containing protein [Bacteroidota bacterium]
MKKLLAFMLFSASLAGFSQDSKVVNEKNAQERKVSGFHAVHVSHGIDLVLTPGTSEKVVISASDPELTNKILTEVKDGVLKIYIENQNWNWHWGKNTRMVAYVSYKQIDDLDASGGSDIKVEGTISGERLSLDISGGGDFNGKVNVKKLNVDVSGGGDLTISGNATDVDIDVSGGGEFKGSGLVTDNCSIDASGGSDISITCNKSLSVESSGGSDVYYKGTAVIKKSNTSGGGSVTRRD